MKNLIKKYLNRFGLMFAFGMKGGDDIIKNQDNDNGSIGVIQTKETKNLGEALMKGEVTQEVAELRYRNYRISREANNYAYIGNGQAVKLQKKERKKKYTFFQNNEHICNSVLETLSGTEKDEFIFKFIYKELTKFKLERYANYGKFTIDGVFAKIELYFDSLNKNPYDPVSYIAVKELDKMSKFNSRYEIENCDVCKNPKLLTFVTKGATDEDDLIMYSFDDLHYESCKFNGVSYVLTFVTNNFVRTDLTDKYFNKEMHDKYENKAPKEQNVTLYDVNKETCHFCGEEVDSYDSSITKYHFGYPVCKKCLKKYNLSIDE